MPESQQSLSFKQWLLVPRPLRVRLTMILVGLQAVAMAGYSLFALVELIVGDFEYLVGALSIIVCTAVVAAVLFAAARGLGDGRTWVRGMIITSQLILLLVGVSFAQAALYTIAIPVLLWAVAVLVLMFSKEVNAYVGQRDLPFTEQE